MADQDQDASPADVALPLIVNFRDQRAGGIEHRKVARRGLVLDAASDAMALNTVTAFGGTSDNSSTKIAPLVFRLSTTYLLWTISWRT